MPGQTSNTEKAFKNKIWKEIRDNYWNNQGVKDPPQILLSFDLGSKRPLKKLK
jgi:hypothetical protein